MGQGRRAGIQKKLALITEKRIKEKQSEFMDLVLKLAPSIGMENRWHDGKTLSPGRGPLQGNVLSRVQHNGIRKLARFEVYLLHFYSEITNAR